MTGRDRGRRLTPCATSPKRNDRAPQSGPWPGATRSRPSCSDRGYRRRIAGALQQVLEHTGEVNGLGRCRDGSPANTAFKMPCESKSVAARRRSSASTASGSSRDLVDEQNRAHAGVVEMGEPALVQVSEPVSQRLPRMSSMPNRSPISRWTLPSFEQGWVSTATRSPLVHSKLHSAGASRRASRCRAQRCS